jgi:hypothetical protein
VIHYDSICRVKNPSIIIINPTFQVETEQDNINAFLFAAPSLTKPGGHPNTNMTITNLIV